MTVLLWGKNSCTFFILSTRGLEYALHLQLESCRMCQSVWLPCWEMVSPLVEPRLKPLIRVPLAHLTCNITSSCLCSACLWSNVCRNTIFLKNTYPDLKQKYKTSAPLSNVSATPLCPLKQDFHFSHQTGATCLKNVSNLQQPKREAQITA